jgi:hypothetical protein
MKGYEKGNIQNAIGAGYKELVPGIPGANWTRVNSTPYVGGLIKSLLQGTTGGGQDLGPLSSYIPPVIRGGQ